MPVTVAFWNVNIGTTSKPKKKSALSDWCKLMKPGMLFLEEVGTLSERKLEDLTGMEALNHVHTLDKNLKPSTKCIWAFQRAGGPFQARVLRFPDLLDKTIAQDRALLKVTIDPKRRPVPNWATLSSYGYFAIWVVHANVGGGGSPDRTAKFLNTTTGQTQLVGGDFNLSVDKPGTVSAQKLRPWSWQGSPLKFSQWKKGKPPIGPSSPDLADYHLTPSILQSPIPDGIKLNPDILDYVMYGSSRTVQPLSNCEGKLWPKVLENFDHCPVMYEVS